MPQEFRGEAKTVDDAQFGIAVARYNQNITAKLLSGALDTLTKAGVPDHSIVVAHVPGAWELPVAAQGLIEYDAFDAIICLGAVIRGETTHDQYINQQVSHSLGQISLEFSVPVMFGLLTCNSLEQAIHRSGGNVGNKGSECAEAALEMVSLMRQLQE